MQPGAKQPHNANVLQQLVGGCTQRQNQACHNMTDNKGDKFPV